MHRLFFKLLSVQFFRLGFFWCVLLVIILGVASRGSAQNYQLHTVYMYSFTKYMQWPENEETDFIINVVGSESEVIPHLQKMAASKKVGARNIVVNIYDDPEAVGNSHMVFLSRNFSMDRALISAWIEKARDAHFLLITDEAEVQGLSHINFTSAKDKLIFELNRKRIESAGLRVSTELLALAKIVDYQQPN